MAQTHHWKFNNATQLQDTIGSLDFTAGYFTAGTIDPVGAVNDCFAFEPGFPNGTIATAFWWTVQPPGDLGPPGGSAASGQIFSVGNFRVSLWNKTLENPEYSPWAFQLRIEDFSAGEELRTYEIIRLGTRFYNQGPNGFTHFTISWDGNIWSIYINGSFSAIEFGSSFTPQAIYEPAAPLIFHADQNYSAKIDDVRIYDIANDGSFAWNGGFSTEAEEDPASGNAYGPLPTILISEPEGSAGGGTGSFGGLTTITVTPPSGIAEFILNASASGSLATITITTLSGIAFPEFIATGSFATITISAIEAIPVISTSIQLDYVACDAEISWTQNLPITGFSSAIQGQDAISSRITPTIGGSGANIVYFEQRTLSASGSYTYDLTSLTDFLGGPLSLSKAYAITIRSLAGGMTLKPGASNPFQWFFFSNTASVSLSAGDIFTFAQPDSATISSGSKTLVVTNSSASVAATYKIAILGGR
jgi:hypothetical protein